MTILHAPFSPVKGWVLTGEDVILQLSLRSFSVIFQKDNIRSLKHSADKMTSQ